MGARLETRPVTPAAINALVRACLCADPGKVLVVSDWAQIEARWLAWACGDEASLQVFDAFDAGDKVNGDPYVANGCAIYGMKPAQLFEVVDGKPKLKHEHKPKRQVGKAATLGLGFQMGAPRFHDYAVEQGADWDALYPVTAADVVKAWRRAHEPIVEHWYGTQEAALEVTEYGGEVEVGPYTWAKIDGLVVNRLPSGRLIAYQGMSVVPSPDAYGKPRKGLRYMSRKGFEHTFGGKLVENQTQAGCACLLRRAVVKCERVGLPVVLTSHDEIVCEVDARDGQEAYDALRGIMCDPPDWAEGLQLSASGYVDERYRKD